jgi:hypothetical protein
MSSELELAPALSHSSGFQSVDREAMSSAWKWWRRHVVRGARRLSRWEFWPAWAFYPPVVVYVLYLGMKHRSFTLFTAANPGIPDGGFIGESKHAILEGLRAADWALPKTMLLPIGSLSDRCTAVECFMQAHRLKFPIVLKPDAGQRGAGVAVIRSNEQLCDYLRLSPVPVIVQEHIPGIEFGVFYYRIPGRRRGRIFSITEKQMPVVIGDGTRTVEELILADERAVCMAEFYLRQNGEHASRIPSRGERVQLVEIGTHCRGAIFLDGSDAITAALEHEIDRIAQCFDGFHFGRFDVRVPSFEDFKVGRNIKVLELNGVTSEATHIYDPKIGLLQAYKALLQQWRLAFKIGELNRRRGVQPSKLSQLLRAVLEYRRLCAAACLSLSRTFS